MSSLRKLRDDLVARGGYTTTPDNRQLNDLKVAVQDLIAFRTGTLVGSDTGGTLSGIKCTGLVTPTIPSALSISDLNSVATQIKSCVCNAVSDTAPFCSARTTACPCNTQIVPCNCNTRSPAACDCQARTYVAGCASHYYYSTTCLTRTVGAVVCDCKARTPNADACDGKYGCSRAADGGECCQTDWTCTCHNRTASTVACICDSRYSGCECYTVGISCGGHGAVPVCNCNTRTDTCDCQARTAACGSRDATSCQCNARCACNVEKRFG